jgi:hypothetical protein
MRGPEMASNDESKSRKLAVFLAGFGPLSPRMGSNDEGEIPDRFFIGEDLNWDAPWVDVNLWVELPFWLMVDNTTIAIEIEVHEFQVSVYDNYFELYGGEITDSRQTVCYQGPIKNSEDLSDDIQEIRKNNPNVPFMWRKCKTILKIATRCNEDVWNKATAETEIVLRVQRTVDLYLKELCMAHIPIINRLIQGYRLATYDYFAFEVAPWDVPRWLVERSGKGGVSSLLLPYRTWDIKPPVFLKFPPAGQPVPYQLIQAEDLRGQISTIATPGEFDLLDAINLMERGDYSGAVRRVTTAIEVVVEAMVGKAIEAAEGKGRAEKFLKETEKSFPRRVKKYQELSGRTLSDVSRKDLSETRNLRHSIVHKGYRISSGERMRAQRSVDTGVWIFNWFENNEERREIRGKRIAFRSLGRADITHGIFPTKITPEGVVVLPPPYMNLSRNRT